MTLKPEELREMLEDAETAALAASKSGDLEVILPALRDYENLKLKVDALDAASLIRDGLALIQKGLHLISAQQDSEDADRPRRVGRPIFRRYKGKRYEATFFDDGSVLLDGVMHAAPSPAAIAVTGSSANGWEWWKYVDPTYGERSISHLRRN